MPAPTSTLKTALTPFVRWTRRQLASPGLEQKLSLLYANSPDWLRPWIVRSGPQPNAYDPSAERHVPRHGCEWRLEPANYAQWVHYFQYDDPSHRVMLKLAAKFRPENALDIGANVGLYSLPLARLLPEHGALLAFEPHPETFARLVEHVTLNREHRIRPVNCALGDRPGVARLFDHDGNCGARSIARASAPTAGTDVEIRTLDAVLDEQQVGRIDLIKLDVEGFEPEVILGAQTRLARDLPLILVELTPQWSNASAFAEMLRWLDNHQYSIFRLTDIARDRIEPVPSHRIGVGLDPERNWVLAPPRFDLKL